jgi:hypothetical protein
MVEQSTRPARARRRIALVAALASFVALLLALAPGTATAGLPGSNSLGVSGSGPGTGTITAIQTIYGGNYQSTIACNWNGLVNTGTCTESVPFGEPPEPIVVFRAQPGPNSNFVQWAIQPAANVVSGCGTSSVCYVQINGQTSVTAGFNTTPGIPLTVFRAGSAANTNGSTVTSSSVPPLPNQINCGNTCTQVFPQGTVVTLTAISPPGVTFGGWSGNGVPAGCGTNPTCTITLTAPLGVTATFNGSVPLTVVEVGQGGIISNVQPGIHCGDGGTACTANFTSGSQVTLTATPDTGFSLQSVSGGGCTGSPCTVTMNQATTVTFTFAATTVQANVRNVNVTYNGPTGRQRSINSTVNAQQAVAVTIRISRQGGGVVATRTFNNVSGVQTLRIRLRDGLAAGRYTVRITFTNDFGTVKQAKPRNVRVRAV